MAWEATEHGNLGRCEESLGNLLTRHTGADAFDIDAKLTAVADGKEGQSVGVGDIKAEPIPARVPGQGGLAMETVGKPQLTRFHGEVAAEDRPEEATRNDEVLAIFLEAKTFGPGSLVHGQGLPQ